MGEKADKIYSGRELAAFCMQISLLLKAAVPLYEGLAIMAEDAVTEQEKEMLKNLSLDVELGDPFLPRWRKPAVFLSMWFGWRSWDSRPEPWIRSWSLSRSIMKKST